MATASARTHLLSIPPPCSHPYSEAPRKHYKLQQLLARRHFIQNRFIVGIDPAKARHQAQILSADGLPVGSSFSFAHSFSGFNHHLWKHLYARLPDLAHLKRHRFNECLAFAIETSCNLWANLTDYLHREHACIVLVSPLSTCHARPSKSGDFSRTDAKDAYLIADLARDARFHFHTCYTADQQAMHCLAITYDKFRKSLQQHYARLRASIERLFPELLGVLKLRSRTARHLLGSYLFPEDFLALDVEREAAMLMQISRAQHGRETLLKLQVRARHTIGVSLSQAEQHAERRSVSAWLRLVEALEAEIRETTVHLIRLSKETPYHAQLVSIKGISDLLAALFLAEVRDPSQITHTGQVERLAGLKLYMHDSGTYSGRRRISHRGNARLRWVLYRMASETAKYVPEVRLKYLRRKLNGHTNRNKNLVAVIPKVLALILALVREDRPYEEREATLLEMHRLEAELERKHPSKRHRPARAAA
ncbi:MAG TPA: IS110 family transposase [Rhodothermales bacterium]|nr:IS110 family transposase [Rhodothermales bacterium]